MSELNPESIYQSPFAGCGSWQVWRQVGSLSYKISHYLLTPDNFAPQQRSLLEQMSPLSLL